MARTSTRTVIPAAVLAAAALALTGCTSHASNNAAGAADTSSASAPSTPAAGDSSPAAPSTPGSATPTAAATPTTTSGSGSGSGSTKTATTQAAPAAAGAPCTSAQLRVARTDPNAGAGQLYAKITFTNTAATSCTLTGYPGVSYVKAAGVQSGNPAQRTGAGYRVVTLAAHGGTASAVMHDSDGIGGYSKGQCDLTSVEGIRVYPPNERAAMFIPFRTQHCAGTSIHPLTIGPVS